MLQLILGEKGSRGEQGKMFTLDFEGCIEIIERFSFIFYLNSKNSFSMNVNRASWRTRRKRFGFSTSFLIR